MLGPEMGQEGERERGRKKLSLGLRRDMTLLLVTAERPSFLDGQKNIEPEYTHTHDMIDNLLHIRSPEMF